MNQKTLNPETKNWLLKRGLGCGLGILVVILIGVVLFVWKPWAKTEVPTALLPSAQQQVIPTRAANQTQPQAPAVLPSNTPFQPEQPAVNNGPTEPSAETGATSVSSDWKPLTLPVSASNELRVGFPSFGSYFTPIIINGMDAANRPYKLVLIPLRFTDPSTGKTLISGSEADQANYLKNNKLDILLNTPDILVKHSSLKAKIINDIDQSDGADKFVRWLKGKTAECAGRDIVGFNDLRGCHIAVMKDSVGEFAVLNFMRISSMTTADVIIDRYDTVDEAVKAFTTGKADAVAGWTPNIDSAIEAGGKELFSSKDLHNITDHLIISEAANNTKPDLIFAFLVDWYKAMKFQQEDPEAAYEIIANWNFQYQDPNTGEMKSAPTNDWTYVYPGTALSDMQLWLKDQVAQADLGGSLHLLNNKAIFLERLINTRESLAWGGANMDEQFVASDLVETKYLERLAQYTQTHPELFPTKGTLIDPNYSPLSQNGSGKLDANRLSQLPTVVEFGCAQFNFSAGETDLKPDTEEFKTFVRCAQSLKQLVMTAKVDILITGSAAYPDWYDYARSEGYAKRRASAIFNALKAAGIPEDRMVWRPVVGTKTTDENQMNKDRWVKIEIKLGGG